MKLKKQSKKTKVKTHKYWHTKLDKLLGEWVREKNTECAMCHRQSDSLQVSHIFPKGAYQNLRYDLMNVLPMDGQCHQFKWHSNPIESFKWFEESYPERYKYLLEVKNKYIKRDQFYYEKVQTALKNKDVRGTLILGY